MKLYCVIALAALLGAAGAVQAATSISLDFNGSGNTFEATGFEAVYNLDPAGFNVDGGSLTINTLPGDIFGQFEEWMDPDDAKNVFWSTLDPAAGTVLEAKVHYANLNSNYHGGGIWMGMDEDHYIRLGLIHNSWEGGLVVEALRENEDLWGERGGPGGDIVGRNSPKIADAWASVDLYLRLVRTGTDVTAWYSLDGSAYSQVNGVFDSVLYEQVPGSYVDGNSFRVGAYAFGGGQTPASVSFDYLTASAVPEPASILALASGLLGYAGLAMRRRTR